MEHTTRRQALGRLGGLLGWLALSLLPGQRAVAVDLIRRQEDEPGPAPRGTAPVARPPQHAVKRNG